MNKNLVFCADGTWNGPGESDPDARTGNPTNVFKLFSNLEGVDTPDSLPFANEQERVARDAKGLVVQHAKYIHGVGDSENPLVKFLGGAFGAGLIARVVRGYTFLSRNYTSGDQIFLVGFSRGAYTARALAGLVAEQGLLDATRLDLDDKEAAYRLGSAVWCQYQRSIHSSLPGKLESFLADLPGFFSSPPSPDQMLEVRIHAVAVWDTVGGMGIPVFAADREQIDLFKFADTKLNPRVDRGIHAISVDERRGDFVPTLWDSDERIIQVLFPGAHADVGGGYPTIGQESGLSDGALDWMTRQLNGLGLLLAPSRATIPVPIPTGPAHQPWQHLPWTCLPTGERTFPAGLNIHQSVLDRFGKSVVPDPGKPDETYSPDNLGLYLAHGLPVKGVKVEA
jgi:uncharacterized protein (DUF2235 family)